MSRTRFSTVLLASALTILASSPAQADEGDIGYPSVNAAREALAARSDVSLSKADGWLTIEDPKAMTLWTFTPDNDPAHPAAIKRSVVEDGERVVIRMDIRCEGDIAACDALEQHFLSLNQDVRDRAADPNDGDPTATVTDPDAANTPEPAERERQD